MYFDKMWELNPADFAYQGYMIKGESFADFEWVGSRNDDWVLFEEPGRCDHCNKRIKHYVVLLDKVKAVYIKVGFNCYHETFVHSCKVELDLYRLKRKAQKKAEKEARLAEAQADFNEQYPGFADKLNAYDGNNWFIKDLQTNLLIWGKLSEKQVAKALEVLEREAERVEVKYSKAPDGRVTFTGKIVSEKFIESQWGSTLKMLVVTNQNYKVWLTKPEALQGSWKADGTFVDGAGVGDEVTITATLKVSDKDECFAFGSRPKV